MTELKEIYARLCQQEEEIQKWFTGVQEAIDELNRQKRWLHQQFEEEESD